MDFDELASILGSADSADYFDLRVLRLFRTDARIGSRSIEENVPRPAATRHQKRFVRREEARA